MDSKPAELMDNNFLDKLHEELVEKQKAAKEPRKTFTMVQFTDVHLDLDYDVGFDTLCGLMICCREEFGAPVPDLP